MNRHPRPSAKARPLRSSWDGDDRPPSRGKQAAEIAWNLARLWHWFGRTGPLGPADGPPALVIPGFLATDRTTTPLRTALADAGWRVHGWNMGWNRGVREDTIERLRGRLDAIGHHEPILIVGWSLGGLFARELARHFPERIRAVVTLGSPFSGDPHQNNVWRLYELIAKHRVDEPPIPRITDKPPVPNLALWSRNDGLIAPRAARGLPEERDEEVELDCAHMAFGVSPRAARRVVREIDRFLKNRG
ncbi:MAG: esterase/lipase family protein [Sphingomicrobium sp.]